MMFFHYLNAKNNKYKLLNILNRRRNPVISFGRVKDAEVDLVPVHKLNFLSR